MRKAWLLFFALAWLAACGSANREQSLVPRSDTPTAPVVSSPAAATSESVAPTAPASIGATVDAGYVAGRTVEEAAQIQPGDHVTGATEPLVTIIEYGDFQ